MNISNYYLELLLFEIDNNFIVQNKMNPGL